MWARLLSALLGVWLMASPALLPMSLALGISNRIAGPLVAASSIIAIWAVTRSLRWLAVPLGLWLLIAPLVLASGGAGGINSAVVGVLLFPLAAVRGPLEQSFGGGWASLLRRSSPAAREGGGGG